MAPVQEANSDNLGIFFSLFYTMIVCCVYSLESPRWKKEFESSTVSEPSVFEPLRLYCICLHLLHSTVNKWLEHQWLGYRGCCELVYWVPWKSFRLAPPPHPHPATKKQTKKTNNNNKKIYIKRYFRWFYYDNVCFVYSLESPLMCRLNIPLFYRRSKRHPNENFPILSWNMLYVLIIK